MKVLVAEDAPLLRQGIVRVLELAGLEVVAQAADADDLRRKARAHRPDVAVIDIRMPPTHTDDGLRAAIELRAERPELGVVILSQHLEEAYAQELLADGARGAGYLLKDRVGDPERFADAVRTVGEGGSAIDPEIVALLVGRRTGDDPLLELTAREREVLAVIAEGRSNVAVARALVVTEGAVEKHVRSIFAKLDLPVGPDDHRRVLAVLAHLRGAAQHNQ
jgi:DNA-binding NarL/FixJ family response regulator